METTAIGSSTPIPYQSLNLNRESLNISVKKENGDTFELSYEATRLNYQSGAQPGRGSIILSPEAGQALRDRLNSEMMDYRAQILKKFMESQGMDFAEPQPADGLSAEDPEVLALEAKMPEYWRSEQTAQRIVDFATSFMSLYEGTPAEFIQMMRDAIEKGFGEAENVLGELPGPVAGLMEKTHRLTMEKLDAFEKSLSSEESVAA